MGFSDFQRSILDHLVGDRMMARLAGFFGVLAALLAVVGLHGVLSYFLAQRRSEIGIRMALVASCGRVVAAMLGNACIMLGIWWRERHWRCSPAVEPARCSSV